MIAGAFGFLLLLAICMVFLMLLAEEVMAQTHTPMGTPPTAPVYYSQRQPPRQRITIRVQQQQQFTLPTLPQLGVHATVPQYFVAPPPNQDPMPDLDTCRYYHPVVPLDNDKERCEALLRLFDEPPPEIDCNEYE